ncbi:lipopolysaccharide export system protein LptA [Oryzisolibacter propanilivorax]|uniref:Lipopolysaccharide export system protein LptA n=1 Tax=Oryzisolibacter propanilivorax TaxID=1527607 RepID=A0A1G9VQ26_9BURK|nr:lipopolysaccharide transport periplasmic protein LptA [Oryzisolibacter propanilivorax]SDM74183.1 lipopolysaccharide export system protein LptA [Oryzisolibacter propanilivorax]
MTFRLLLSSLCAALALAWVPAAHAEKADRNKPMNIEADALRHDELQQVTVFTGHVVMTKGSIVLRGARLEVRQDASGYQSGVVTADKGQRAFFRQKRDTAPGAPEEFVEGEAERIEYDGQADVVRLIRRGELRRYRAGTLSDELTGARIVYNNATDVFTVEGGTQAQGAGGSGGRVRAVLAPKEAPAAPKSPAAPAAPLRSSPALDGAKP